MTSLRAAVLGIAAIGASLLGAGATSWLEVEASTAISRDVLAVPGSQAVPLVQAAGLVLLAAALALALAGRLARVLAAVVIGAAGLAVVVATAGFIRDPAPAALTAVAAATGVRRLDAAPSVTAWPAVALVIGVLAAAAGLVVARLSGGWATSAGRYERPARPPGRAAVTSAGPPAGTPAEDPAARAMDDWDALSRGEDPSAQAR